MMIDNLNAKDLLPGDCIWMNALGMFCTVVSTVRCDNEYCRITWFDVLGTGFARVVTETHTADELVNNIMRISK